MVVTDNIAGVTPQYVSGDTNGDSKLDLDENGVADLARDAVDASFAPADVAAALRAEIASYSEEFSAGRR